MTREGQQEGGVVVTRGEEKRQPAAINGGEVSWTVGRFVGVGVGVGWAGRITHIIGSGGSITSDIQTYISFFVCHTLFFESYFANFIIVC